MTPEPRKRDSDRRADLRRRLALVRAAERALRRRWLARLGWVAGWLVALGFAMPLIARLAAGDSGAFRLVWQSLYVLSWCAGAVALSMAADQARLDRESGLEALAAQRGFDPHSLEWARVVGSARSTARVIAWPAVGLTLLGLATSPKVDHALDGLVVLGMVLFYALALGAGLAALARWSSRLSPRHPKQLLAAMVLGPFLVARIEPTVPNVVAGADSLLRYLEPFAKVGT